MSKIIFVTGIDTNIGKSYATGFLAKQYITEGFKTITQKFIQTGNSGISEDIEVHRKLMGTGLLPEDIDGTTCPVVLSYPASPHLAAKIDNVKIDLDKISNSIKKLAEKYDVVLIEGAGGIMVPITESYTTLDYIKAHNLPVVVVTAPKLGSINHTLLTLQICKYNHITVEAVAYNKYNIEDNVICNDTEEFIKNYLRKEFKNSKWLIIPELK